MLCIMIGGLKAEQLGSIAKVDLIVPLPDMTIERFVDLSIGYIPKAIVKDGLPFFGSKRGDFKRKPRVHKGYDIYLNHTDVIASADGVVKEIAHGKLSGTYIKVLHNNSLETLYIHLTSVGVEIGEYVKKGQVLGRIDGPAGNAVAAQLHYEIKLSGVHQDPLGLIKKTYAHNSALMEKIAVYEREMQKAILKRDALVEIYLRDH